MNAFADPLDQLTSILINDQINQNNMCEIDETIDDILHELTRKNNAFLQGVQKLHGLFTTEVSSFEVTLLTTYLTNYKPGSLLLYSTSLVFACQTLIQNRTKLPSYLPL